MTAALNLIGICFDKHYSLMEASFTTLAPYLFTKVVDQKEQVKTLAIRILRGTQTSNFSC